MKQMITWTKSVAMSTLLSIVAVSGMGLTSIAAVSSQKAPVIDKSLTTVSTEAKGEEQLAHRSYGRCRRVSTRHKNLRVRTYPWGRVINALHPGTRVRVISYHDGWAKISSPCHGYVAAHYLRHC